jgi:hypothetical protein
MNHRTRLLLSSLLAAMAAIGCSKKEEPDVTVSCLVSYQGVKVQCFEYHVPAAEAPHRKADCANMEGEGKALDGPCPTEGMKGSCAGYVPGSKTVHHTYRDGQALKKSCEKDKGTFTASQ